MRPQDRKQRNAELYSRIQSGDRQAADALIEENMPGVIRLASLFLEKNQYQMSTDDLVGEAMLAVTEQVRTLAETPDNHVDDINPYLVIIIRRAFRRVIDDRIAVGPRHTMQKELRQRDNDPGKKETKRKRDKKTVDDFFNAGQQARNTELYRRIASGGAGIPSAVEYLVDENTANALTIIDAWIEDRPKSAHLRDKMLPVAVDGMIAETEALTRPHEHVKNINRRFVRIVRDACKMVRRREAYRESMDAFYHCVDDFDLGALLAEISDTEEFEQLDEILVCCYTPFEESVVRMRVDGYTYQEIADSNKTGIATVQRAVARIRDRLWVMNGVLKWDGEPACSSRFPRAAQSLGYAAPAQAVDPSTVEMLQRIANYMNEPSLALGA